jgi:hypothetical protein
MLALSILAVVLVMLSGSFHTVAAGKVQGENRLALDQEGRLLLAELSTEIRGAVQTPLIPSRTFLYGQARMQNALPLDTIMVSSIDPGHRRALEGFGAEDTVGYSTQPNPNNRKWFLLLRQQNSSLLGIDTGDGHKAPVVLADNLLSLHIKYFNGTSWSESWNSQSLPPGQAIPQQVSIDLSLGSVSGPPLRLSTIVVLPMALPEW